MKLVSRRLGSVIDFLYLESHSDPLKMVGYDPFVLGNDQPFLKGHGESRDLEFISSTHQQLPPPQTVYLPPIGKKTPAGICIMASGSTN